MGNCWDDCDADRFRIGNNTIYLSDINFADNMTLRYWCDIQHVINVADGEECVI